MSPDTDSSPPNPHIAIVGGGVTGLAAAHRLLELDSAVGVTLFESGPRCGGSLHTIEDDGFLIELGADSFSTKLPGAIELVRRMDWEDHVVSTQEAHRRALVVCRGRPVPVPDGFVIMAPGRLGPLLRSPILSMRGKFRVMLEPWIPKSSASDVSVAEFARRRLGRETYHRLVQPLFGGIYTGDPEQLSLQATAPQFWEWEQQGGGLVRGAQAAAAARQRVARSLESESGARYSQFMAPRKGMGALVERLVARIPSATISLETPVEGIARTDRGQWNVSTRSAGNRSSRRFDAVIVTTPPRVAAVQMSHVDASLESLLAAIPSSGAAVVTLGYARQQVGHPLNAFGMVVPQIEQRRILAISFASVKFAGRAPERRVLLRVFLGGVLQPELLERNDEELAAIAEQETRELLDVDGAASPVHVARWNGAMPQYTIGHLNRVQRIEAHMSLYPGLELAGNAYHGVGIAQCIQSGEEAAARAIQYAVSTRRRKPR